METEYLGIPIYLDSNTLLDLLASMEDGFSTASKIVTRDNDSKSIEVKGEGSFGISGVFNMFKIGFKGSGERTTDQSSGEEKEEERYHTYGSLMNRLLKNLSEDNIIKNVNNKETWDGVTESDFIILQGKFIPNPLANSFKIINNVFDLILGLNTEVDSANSATDLTTIHNPLNVDGKQISEMGLMNNMIKRIVSDLEKEDYEKYVIELKGLPENRIVSYLFKEYIRDHSGAELPYGEFKMLGKVVRKIEGDDEGIDLLQGSALNFSEEVIEGFVDSIKTLTKDGFPIPKLFTNVNSPALQVIPVAVFI